MAVYVWLKLIFSFSFQLNVRKRPAQETSPPPPVSHMPRRVVAESESEEEETAAEEGPGHVAMGEDDTEALSAAPTAVHASNAAVHAPHGFGCTHLLELPD